MILYPNHVSIKKFAEMKKRSRVVIYDLIKAKKIETDEFGMGKVKMINWAIYKDLDIPDERKKKPPKTAQK